MKKIHIVLVLIFFVSSIQVQILAVEEIKSITYGQILNELGLINGYNNDLLEDKLLTRAEMISIIYRLSKYSSTFDTNISLNEPTFADVPKTHWAYKEIEFAFKNGVTYGLGNGKFGVDDPVTYQQAVAFLVRLLGYDIEYKDMLLKASSKLNIGLVNNKDGASELLRGDVFELVAQALFVNIFEGEELLSLLPNFTADKKLIFRDRFNDAINWASLNNINLDDGDILMQLAEFSNPVFQPVGSFNVAKDITVLQGYQAEYFVENTGFNMPVEIVVTPDEKLYISSKRENKLLQFTLEGERLEFVQGVSVSTAVADEQGNLYIYDNLEGSIRKVSPSGNITSLISSTKELISFNEGKMVLSEDNHLLMIVADKLYEIDMKGTITLVMENLPFITDFYKTSDHRFIMSAFMQGYELSLTDKSYKSVYSLEGHSTNTANALTGDENGNLYCSNDGKIYKIDKRYKVEVIATLPSETLSGLEYIASSGILVGAEKLKGGVWKIDTATGEVNEIIEGNGLLSPISIAFSTGGDLVVSNDDGSNISLISATGETRYWFHYWSYTPPIPHILVTQDNVLYATETEVVNKDMLNLIIVPSEGLAQYGEGPIGIENFIACGIAQKANGDIIISNTFEGKIQNIDTSMKVTDIYTGLTTPQAMALDKNDDLYVLTGGSPISELLNAPFYADDLICIKPDGKIEELGYVNGIDLIVGPDGNVYIASFHEIKKYNTVTRSIETFATGFNQVGGLAFDVEGNLYATDIVRNSITRISGFETRRLQGKFDLEGDAQDYKLQIYRTLPLISGQFYDLNSDGSFDISVAPGTYTVELRNSGGIIESYEVSAEK